MSHPYSSLAFEEKEQQDQSYFEPTLSLFHKPDLELSQSSFFPTVTDAQPAVTYVKGKITVSF